MCLSSTGQLATAMRELERVQAARKAEAAAAATVIDVTDLNGADQDESLTWDFEGSNLTQCGDVRDSPFAGV